MAVIMESAQATLRKVTHPSFGTVVYKVFSCTDGYRREVEAHRKLTSSNNRDTDTNILPLLDCVLFEGNPTCVFPHRSEGDLMSRLMDRRLENLHDLLLDTSMALSEVHRCGMVHGDVKPENVLLNGRGFELIDFGLSGTVGEEPLGGSRSYVSPQHKSVRSPRDDIWSLGVTLAVAQTRFLPDVRSIHRFGIDAWPKTGAWDPMILHATQRCLQLRPSQRPRDAVELTADIFVHSSEKNHPDFHKRRRQQHGERRRPPAAA